MKMPSSEIIQMRSQFFYAVIVIVILPILFVAYTFWSMNQYVIGMDRLAQQQSIIVHDVLKALDIQTVYDTELLKQKIDRLVAGNSSISGITFLTQTDGKFQVVVSSDSRYAESDSQSELLSFINPDGQPRIMLGSDPITNNQIWTTGSYLSSYTSGQKAILLIHTDATMAQRLVADASRQSLIFLAIGLVVILLVLFNHFRFFDYARLYRRLQEVDALKDDFFSAASHEIRTPLTSIRGYANMALEELDNSDHVKHDLQIIAQSAARLSDMVENMLDMSRIQQGRLNLDFSKVSIILTLKDVFDELLPQLNQKSLQFTHDVPDRELMVMADSTKLRQVFVNLISNAIKYTEAGKIFVSYSYTEKEVIVTVGDTGIGMTKEDCSKLFTKFYRVRSHDTEKIQGTGLGLWITKQLIELMHGKIRVESQVNQGTKFYITLPLVS